MNILRTAPSIHTFFAALAALALVFGLIAPQFVEAAVGTNWTEATGEAEWPARDGHSSAVFDDRLWVMGGAGGSGSLNDVWYSEDGVTWTEATSTAEWSARDGLASSVFDDKLWIMGGYAADGAKNDVWYSEDGVTWTEASDAAGWPGRGYHASAVFNDKLWIMGGLGDDGGLNDVWYSEDGVTWTEATDAAAWTIRDGPSSVVFDDKLWIMGGIGDTDSTNDVWHSEDGATWTEATDAAEWPVRYYHASSVFDDKLWIMGGHVDNVGDVNDVWYSPLLYSLSFDEQGGSPVSDIPDQAPGASLTLPAAPARSGYVFQGWNTASDGTGTSHDAEAAYTMPADDTALYAIWETEPEPEEPRRSSSSGSSVRYGCKDEGASNYEQFSRHKQELCRYDTAAPTATSSVPSLGVRDLELGMIGGDVLALQKLLNANGFALAQTGIGSPGSETSFFGSLTQKALASYQQAKGIAPAAGYFGPITRAQMKSSGLQGLWW